MDWIIQAAYFIAAVLFIIGLKQMSSPVTARRGIVWAGVGMVLATLVTFVHPQIHTNYVLMVLAIGIGGGTAWVSGKKVAMTDMPQMIALYNGMGGGAAAAIAAVELLKGEEMPFVVLLMAVVGGLIGAVAFSGSAIAFAKLQGIMRKAVRFKGQKLVNLSVFSAAVLFGLIILNLSGQVSGFGLFIFLRWRWPSAL